MLNYDNSAIESLDIDQTQQDDLLFLRWNNHMSTFQTLLSEVKQKVSSDVKKTVFSDRVFFAKKK